ncbi:tRNA-binding protein [Desulfonatronum thiosulfatophilum]|uniref:tRNA-binding protein n=1 Tax=Desulfonatronum thiosulfatophilum TaxID=617002 RepID=A0A1G6EID5_9BACT|nr:tRNA-binding protein [Desulfonatronum thiosulfatophilum]SDB57191.1 tRNA-binding protein [Desulfonatronum thiosulfatophilum]
MSNETITWEEFQQVAIHAGTVVEVKASPKARKPAYVVMVDFGPEIGIKQTSARITDHYTPDELVGRQVVGVVNFPVKQIGPVRSEFLLTGFYRPDGTVILAVPDKKVPDGAKLG